MSFDQNKNQDEILRRWTEKYRSELGPLLPFVDDPDVAEIWLNPNMNVWVTYLDGKGKVKTDIQIPPSQSNLLLRSIASRLGKTITEENPILSGVLPDGSRFQGEIPPIVDRPSFNIRKKAVRIFTLDEYVESGILSPDQRRVISEAIKNRKNILVVGGTGSGKTTLTNAILQELATLDPKTRVVMIEDIPELQCPVEDHVNFYVAQTERTDVSMDVLLRTTLRKTPDRIVVGEVRGKEAHVLLKAWSTGHPGGACTVHADDAREGVQKIYDYANEAIVGQINPKSVSRTVNLAVFISKTPTSPGRRVEEIVVIDGFRDGEFIVTPIETKGDS